MADDDPTPVQDDAPRETLREKLERTFLKLDRPKPPNKVVDRSHERVCVWCGADRETLP